MERFPFVLQVVHCAPLLFAKVGLRATEIVEAFEGPEAYCADHNDYDRVSRRIV